jgi:micrococcal nuclease
MMIFRVYGSAMRWVLSLMLIVALSPLAAAEPALVLQARVVRVIDGDSLVVAVKGWPDAINPVELRLAGIDAAEMPPRSNCQAELEKAVAARDLVARAAAPGSLVTVTWPPHRYDKYRRMLVTVSGGSIADIGALLRAKGLAREYHGGRRGGWCAQSQ